MYFGFDVWYICCDLYYEVIHGICFFYFMFCEIKKFILVYLYFSHMRLCFCLVFQEFTG